jgi:hypothetical protein
VGHFSAIVVITTMRQKFHDMIVAIPLWVIYGDIIDGNDMEANN